MRVVGIVAWALALAASLVFLWFGVYRVLAPTRAEPTLCVGADLPWFLAGVVLNVVAAAIAFGALRARWWTLGIALPALAAVVQLLLPCSFVLPLVLPAAALISVASAVVVVVRARVRSAG